MALGAPGSASVVVLTLEAGTGGDIAGYAYVEAPSALATDGDFGRSLSYADDYDGNGSPELIVGTPGTTSSDPGNIVLHFMDSGGLNAFRTVTISATAALGSAGSSGITRFGRTVTNIGAHNPEDVVSDISVGSRYDYPGRRRGRSLEAMPGTGSVGVLFMEADSSVASVSEPPSAPPKPSPPPGSPPSIPPGASYPYPSPPPFGDSVGNNDTVATINKQEGNLPAEWFFGIISVLVLLLGVILFSWLIFYKAIRRKEFVNLPEHLAGGNLSKSSPITRAAFALREGHITPTCRIEIRGAATAARAHRVRASNNASAPLDESLPPPPLTLTVPRSSSPTSTRALTRVGLPHPKAPAARGLSPPPGRPEGGKKKKVSCSEALQAKGTRARDRSPPTKASAANALSAALAPRVSPPRDRPASVLSSDGLLYAANVPGGNLERVQSFARAPATAPASTSPIVVDLSRATESLLRGEEGPIAGKEPAPPGNPPRGLSERFDYAPNVPGNASAPGPSGHAPAAAAAPGDPSAMREGIDNSQLSWSEAGDAAPPLSDTEPLIWIPPMAPNSSSASGPMTN